MNTPQFPNMMQIAQTADLSDFEYYNFFWLFGIKRKIWRFEFISYIGSNKLQAEKFSFQQYLVK